MTTRQLKSTPPVLTLSVEMHGIKKNLQLVTLALTALLTLSACSEPATPPSVSLNDPIQIKSGLVSGSPSMLVDDIKAFKGIPFAAPPIGDLRWKAPQAVDSWNGTFLADTFNPVCMQSPALNRFPNNVTTDLPDSPPVSEDCLYLNVWTPAQSDDEKLPVMVWIYGGAYTEGGGSTPHNNGSFLAEKGVIVVTFNYRLGAFGFLAHPELTAESEHNASGNYALADSIAALEWVQDNISAFGGDPSNVTIFGESAGSAMTAALVGSPVASGLFQKAIAESGTWMGLNMAPMVQRDSAEQQTLQAATELGAENLNALRQLSAEEVLASLPRQGMIIDGWIIPEDLSLTFAEGRQNPVDLIVGSNRDEGSFTSGFGPAVTIESWRDGAEQRWGNLAELGLAAYPTSNEDDVPNHSSQSFTDNMAWIMRLFAEQQTMIGQQAYVYLFTEEPVYPADGRNIGVCHACEIPFVFNNLGTLRVYPDGSSPELALQSESNIRAADITSSYWTNFAKFGDPNGEGLAHWPTFSTIENGPILHISASPELGDSLGTDKVTLYNALYERQMSE